MWVGTCIPAAWPRLQNIPIPGNFKKLVLHVFGNSFSSISCLDVLGLSQNDKFSFFCFKIKLGFFVRKRLETDSSFPAPLCFRQMALLQIPVCVHQNEVDSKEHLCFYHLEFWFCAKAPVLRFIAFKTCSDTAFKSKGGGVGVFILFLLEP